MNIQLSENFSIKKIILYALPNIGTMLAITSFQMIDGFFVSNWLGVLPFAAVNLTFPLILIFAAPGFMIGSGGSAIISKSKGEGNIEQARKYFSMLVATLLIFGIFFSAIIFIFLPEILILIGASEELIPFCLEFGRTTILFLPCFLISLSFQSLWVAAEKPTIGFRLALLQGAVIIFLDWLLIVQMNFGIEGAALATSLGMFSFMAITLKYFSQKNSSGLHFVKFSFDIKKILKICYNGSSEMMDAVSVNIIELLLNLQLMRLIGEIGVAAFGVYTYVNEFFLSIFFAFSTTAITIIGYKFGEKNFSEIKSLLKKNIILNITSGIILTSSAIFLAEEIAKIYVGYDEKLFELTTKVLQTCSLTFIFYGFNLFASAYFTAQEKSSISATIAFFQSLIMPIIFIFLLPEIFEAEKIFYALPLATFSTTIFAIFCLCKKKLTDD